MTRFVTRFWKLAAVVAGAVVWRYLTHHNLRIDRRRCWSQRTRGFRRAPEANGDVVPASWERQDELVSLASIESFPASDPPSYWARTPHAGRINEPD